MVNQETEREWKTIRRSNCVFGILITVMTGIIFILFIGYLSKKQENPDIEQSHSLFVQRNKWIDDMGRIGSKQLKTPVSKVILFETASDTCKNCITKKIAENYYPKFEDIKENFFIAQDGTVFEGRGFSREGSMKSIFEDIYDNDAISKNIVLFT